MNPITPVGPPEVNGADPLGTEAVTPSVEQGPRALLPPGPIADPARDILYCYPPPFSGWMHDQAVTMLRDLQRLLPRLPLRAWQLLWQHFTQAHAAAHALEQAEQVAYRQLEESRHSARRQQEALDQEEARIEMDRSAVEEEHRKATAAFAVSMAAAGLALAEQEEISPEAITRALDRVERTVDSRAGDHGVMPVAEKRRSTPEILLRTVLSCAAHVVVGALMMACLLITAGLSTPKEIWANSRILLCGSVLVWLLGESAWHGICLLFHACEAHRDPVPRLRIAWVVALTGLLLTLIVVGEIVLEAMGIRQAYLLQLMRQLRSDTQGAHLPMVVFLLTGMMITLPLVASKTLHAAYECVNDHRRAWLIHLQDTWRETRLADANVKLALGCAGLAQHTARKKAEVIAALEAVRARRAAIPEPQLDPTTDAHLAYLRQAAHGYATLLQNRIEELVEHLEPLTSRQDPEAETA